MSYCRGGVVGCFCGAMGVIIVQVEGDSVLHPPQAHVT